MFAYIHFKNDNITPLKWGIGSSNVHSFQCQKMEFYTSSGKIHKRGTPVILFSFSPLDLESKEVQIVVKNRLIFEYGDSQQRYIEIPCEEIVSCFVRTEMR